MIAHAILGVTAAAFTCACWFGRSRERAAVAGLAVFMTLTPLVDHMQSGSFRWGVALIDGVALAYFVVLALGHRRWWPIPLAGFQLIVVFTHIVAMGPDFIVWTIVTGRILAWCGILLALFFAAYEAHVVRRYGLDLSDAPEPKTSAVSRL